MWELDCEESWAPKNWCFWNVVLEKTLESPLDCKEIQPVHSEGDQPWDFFGGNDAEAEVPVLWPAHGKSWLIGKDSDAGRDWGQEEKGMTETEMAEWRHRLDGREFGWTPGVGDGQGGLAYFDSWGRKESDTTERLNWTEDFTYFILVFIFILQLPRDATTTQCPDSIIFTHSSSSSFRPSSAGWLAFYAGSITSLITLLFFFHSFSPPSYLLFIIQISLHWVYLVPL